MPLNVKLFREIQKAIREEPKRINMGSWVTPLIGIPKSRRPACKTVACIAGWACVLGGRAKNGRGLAILAVSTEAKVLLGLNDSQGFRLFHSGNWPSEWRDKLWAHSFGTHRYARIVAAYIGHFVKQEKQVEKQEG